MNPEAFSHVTKEKALHLGFASAGITDLEPVPHDVELSRWLEKGMAATMGYMHRQAAKRSNPAAILPGATRAVVVTRNYYQSDPAPAPGTGRVAKYARGRDYHAALSRPLRELAAFIRATGPVGTIARAFVDAGPVPERELAQRAGVGWIGKNTMLIDPARGSFFFIGTVLTSADLAVDQPFEADRCGTCRRCLDACPTDAFADERVLDSRRCISYLTIEHQGDIDPALQPRMDNWAFGCDVCQDVCPWNVSFAQEANDAELQLDPALAQVPLAAIVGAEDAELDRRYGWTAMERARPEGLRRNARIALTNLGREPKSKAV